MNRAVYLAGVIALIAVLISKYGPSKQINNTWISSITPGSGEFFDHIAPNYDLMNRIISIGFDQSWRRAAIAKAMPATSLLDVSTGTADLAIAAAAIHSVHVVGIDPSAEMLNLARLKLQRAKQKLDNVQLVQGRAEQLPFESQRFDSVIVAFGVRNFQDREKGLAEMVRVLKPGGRFVVLEASITEEDSLLHKGLELFVDKIMPRIASVVTGDFAAYQYLSSSMHDFPRPKKFMEMLSEAGLAGIEHSKLAPFGLGPDLYTAVKE